MTQSAVCASHVCFASYWFTGKERDSESGLDNFGARYNDPTIGSAAYPAWGLSDTYDRHGNRTAQSISSGCTGITCPTSSLTISTSTNRVTGSPYNYQEIKPHNPWPN